MTTPQASMTERLQQKAFALRALLALGLCGSLSVGIHIGSVSGVAV